jgi:hypothetical protein
VSAFILFLVQPMIGKLILPKLGGTPQVWNTCMVFFQMVLLAGYAYTHIVSTRLKLRQQLMLHSALLLVPLAVLFLMPVNLFNLRTDWEPSNLGGNPIPDTLRILAMVIGVPFLIVATTAPLLQKWFAYTGHPAAKDPYFLYGASNLGSLLALVAYPVVLEPALRLDTQTWVWAIGYFVLVGSVLGCVGLVWGRATHAEEAVVHHEPAHAAATPEMAVAAQETTAVTASAPAPSRPTGIRPGKKGPRGAGGQAARDREREAAAREREAAAAVVHRPSDDIDWWRRLRWVALAAVPSSLMLGITTHITTDLSPIPLFWVIPLALYLLTFILVFSRWPFNWIEQAHPIMLYIQPIAIAVMLFFDMLNIGSTNVWVLIVTNVIGFFATTLVCHGELAKDRPSTRYLTEFYLWMSVGGMVGGMFNALFAPVVFRRLLELSIAIFAACLLRPKMKDSGWTDEWIAGMLEPAPEPHGQGARGARAPRPQAAAAHAGATPGMTLAMDFILPAAVMLLTMALAFVTTGWVESIAAMFRSGDSYGLVIFLTFGIPLCIACFFYARPLRFALAIGALMLVNALYQSRGEAAELNDRSFFGIISVKRTDGIKIKAPNGEDAVVSYRRLIHGHIDHGMNFLRPDDPKDWGNPNKDFSRVATTYYHRLGPAGRVMELFNWFPNSPDNSYWADARMPAAIIGNALLDSTTGALPYGNLVNLWSEPPFATVGLGTGTMASYGRPYQHVHYYEIDNHIRKLSLPGKEYPTYYDEGFDVNDPRLKFSYLYGAISRGSHVQVFMGDARLRMALPYKNFAKYIRYLDENKDDPEYKADPRPPGGPQNFYHMMVVDAFSSDAIPAHLLTKEAVKMYFEHLSEEGVLCVHTSNRFVELPKVVAAVCAALNKELTPEQQKEGYSFSCSRGHDQAPDEMDNKLKRHYTSEWVMVTRKPQYLTRVTDMTPRDYDDLLRAAVAKYPRQYSVEQYWSPLNPQQQFLWTDDYYTLWTVLRK